jgi:hypothetical protein
MHELSSILQRLEWNLLAGDSYNSQDVRKNIEALRGFYKSPRWNEIVLAWDTWYKRRRPMQVVRHRLSKEKKRK